MKEKLNQLLDQQIAGVLPKIAEDEDYGEEEEDQQKGEEQEV
jgi:hypothetical protein